ncbi:MAG: winged helix-turn-helix domain-containing protein [Myxococcota bacterium]|nr:winged helix-turn-helix domain-containing protein [Myxococcota bacterium]
MADQGPIRALVIGPSGAAARTRDTVQASRCVHARRVSVTGCSHLAEALDRIGRGGADCAVVFVENPCLDGDCTIIARVREADPALPIVVVAEARAPEAGASSVRAGAQEYIQSSDLETGLLRAILCARERHRAGEERGARQEIICFGDYELDPCCLELRERGELVKLHRTPLRLLAHLARNAHQTVSKEELLREVWGDAVVSDAAISSALKELRRALRDDGARQRVVETRRGAGYRFVAPLVAARQADAPLALAVLPLANLCSDPDQDFFARGMTESLTNALAHLPEVRVVSHDAATAGPRPVGGAREIACELGVDLLVTGSVAREGRRVRVSAQLLDAASGRLVWAEQYDRDSVKLLPVEREVAEAVLEAVRVLLSPGGGAPCGARAPRWGRSSLRGA